MQRLFFFFTLLTKHVLFMYNYVKVKFATSDLVSYYLIHVIFFFQFIPCTYVIFFLLCALLALELLYSGTPLMRPLLGHKILVVITRWLH